ncbi:MAG TPA: FtsX-like permease family protein [Bacteroidetes bacterium]|nr:FtsX-like permease family protein [Bacteroidota bacterium]HEX05038.1 FtsX-like permease family protein [Bacteroidota bacterium]
MGRKIRGAGRAIWEGFVIATAALIANKTRASLTTLGIVIGVITVTMMMMIIQGLNQSFQDQISFLGAKTVYVERWPWIWDDDWWKYINRPRITMDQYEALRERLTGAEELSPMAWTGRSVSYRDKQLDRVSILGTTAEHSVVGSTLPEYGRYITALDNRSSKRAAVIGVDVRDALFGPLDPMGRSIRIASRTYTIVGILEQQGNFFGQSRDNIIIIPIQALFNDFGRVGRDISIAVKGSDEVSVEDLTDEIRGVMRAARNLKPFDDDNFAVNQQDALSDLYDALTGGVYAAGLIIGGISLLVGGIGIMNIMLVSVTERTWEIGMRKAIGARTSHILWQFLVEAMLICMIGGTLGILLAFAGGQALKQAMPVVLPAWLAFSAVLFSAGIGLVFGLFPAAKAARMDPIQALRAQ